MTKLEGDETQPRGVITQHNSARLLKNYMRPSCAPSFVKSRMLCPLQTHFLLFQQIFFVLLCIHPGMLECFVLYISQAATSHFHTDGRLIGVRAYLWSASFLCIYCSYMYIIFISIVTDWYVMLIVCTCQWPTRKLMLLWSLSTFFLAMYCFYLFCLVEFHVISLLILLMLYLVNSAQQ